MRAAGIVARTGMCFQPCNVSVAAGRRIIPVAQRLVRPGKSGIDIRNYCRSVTYILRSTQNRAGRGFHDFDWQYLCDQAPRTVTIYGGLCRRKYPATFGSPEKETDMQCYHGNVIFVASE
nr:hypothetical protein [uncultured Rhodopila sp.]